MSLNYDEIKSEESLPHTSMSSYSDLFAALAFIFLFLYVVSTVQLSLESISSQIEYSKYETQLKEYEVEVQAVEVVSDDEPAEVNLEKVLARLKVLEKQTNQAADQFAQQVQSFQDYEKELLGNYQNTFKQIKKRNNYLATELTQEKRKSRQESRQFEVALADREKKLEKQQQKIEDLKHTASAVSETNNQLVALQQNLERKIAEKSSLLDKFHAEKAELAEDNQFLRLAQTELKQELTGKTGEVKKLLKDKETIRAEKLKLVAAQEKLEAGLRDSLVKLRTQEREKINALAEKQRFVAAQKSLENQLSKSKDRLRKIESANRASRNEKTNLAAVQESLKRELEQSQLKLKTLENDNRISKAEKAKLLADQKQLAANLSINQGKHEALRKDQVSLAAEKQALIAAQKQLQEEIGRAGERLQEMERAQAEAASDKQNLLAEKQGIAQKLAGSQAKLKEVEQGRDAAAAERERLAAIQTGLEDKLAAANQKLEGAEKINDAERAQLLAAKEDLENKLGDYQEKERLKKDIVARLKENFDKNNIDAVINEKTGEVILPFKKAYFDFDSDYLNASMKEYLQKIVPVYSESIFGQDDIDKHIQSIEVMGFASPIYKGKYVDPRRLSNESRTALNYNMDLSYRRALSIFKYILNKNNMDFDKQDDLMVFLKVTGRSYLETTPSGLSVEDGVDMDDFCDEYNCEEFHRAIIRFNLI
jgi:chromosome segregation ATPase